MTISCMFYFRDFLRLKKIIANSRNAKTAEKQKIQSESVRPCWPKRQFKKRQTSPKHINKKRQILIMANESDIHYLY